MAAEPPGRAEDKLRGWLWYLAAVVTTLAILAIPLFASRRYYFYGDTQIGSFGQWYHFGQSLLEGRWPYLDLGGWRGGNAAAEGQVGLFNPVIMAIAVLSTKTSSALAFATAVKVGTALFGMSGVYVLARQFRVAPPWAYVAATATLLGGVTQYLDLATWMTGLEVWALVPWCWWAIRRTMTNRANPALALVFCYLMVSIGYVYGTIYLVLVFVACLVDGYRLHGKGAVLRVLGMGVCAGLLTLTVYLPGVLTAPVTARNGLAITNDNSLAVQVSNYFASMIPATEIPANGIARSANPVGYIAWFLPLLAFVDRRRIRAALRPMTGMILVLVVFAMWSVGPTIVGPLRYPARVMPIVAMCAILLTVVLIDRASTAPRRGRLFAALATVVVGAYLGTTRAVWHAIPVLIQMALILGGVVLVWGAWRMLSKGGRTGRFGSVGAGTCAVIVAVFGVGLSAEQHIVTPLPASTNRNMPADVADYAPVLADAKGDVMVIGDQRTYLQKHPDAAADILIGSSWYLTDREVSNSYSTISFRTYMNRYCIGIVGATCRGAAATLASTEPTTGLPRADLLSLSTLLIFKPTTGTVGEKSPPPGWHVAKVNDLVVMWVRDKPLPTAGGVVHTSTGTTVTEVRRDDNAATIRVDQVPSSGGTVTFSRLAWPGYKVDGGARLATPVDQYLLTIDVPGSAVGRTVTVRFAPPGFALEMGAWALSVLASVLWVVVAAVRRRREHSGRPLAAAPPAPSEPVAESALA